MDGSLNPKSHRAVFNYCSMAHSEPTELVSGVTVTHNSCFWQAVDNHEPDQKRSASPALPSAYRNGKLGATYIYIYEIGEAARPARDGGSRCGSPDQGRPAPSGRGGSRCGSPAQGRQRPQGTAAGTYAAPTSTPPESGQTSPFHPRGRFPLARLTVNSALLGRNRPARPGSDQWESWATRSGPGPEE